MPMNQEFKKEWTEALRSGKFEQATGALQINGRFCCLGVACELLKDRLKLDVTTFDGITMYNGASEVLPPVVQSYMGVSNESASYGGTTLTIENDDGKTFSQIADIIDKYF